MQIVLLDQYIFWLQYCLIAFLILVEAKLKTWAVKYGREPEVQLILDEYRGFVGSRNIFQEFDRAFQEMQQVSEVYKKYTNLSKFYCINNVCVCFVKIVHL